MAAQPVSAATTAATTPALEGGASRQYWGRAGRAALWTDINTDEYAQGRGLPVAADAERFFRLCCFPSAVEAQA